MAVQKIITLENVTKEFSGNCVIDDVTHTFNKGAFISFCGHNGCGKSTMLKLLAGLISLSSGNVDYHQKLRFSYVPERFPGMELTMIDYLRSIAGIEGISYEKADELINDFYLDEMIYTRMDKLSKGSLQKVGVIQALLAPHDVLLLDEPLSGQDMDSQNVFISKVKDLRKNGVTVFMSCHEKKLIDELSDEVYTIEHGKLVEGIRSGEVSYKVYVRKNSALPLWPDMQDAGARNLITVPEPLLRETIMRLYGDGWEIVGIEENA